MLVSFSWFLMFLVDLFFSDLLELQYNEGWLLRVVLDWFSRHKIPNHLLNFQVNARWFSEALLPLVFLARHRGDPLAENWTHADGVVGHFTIGDQGKADLSLYTRCDTIPGAGSQDV